MMHGQKNFKLCNYVCGTDRNYKVFHLPNQPACFTYVCYFRTNCLLLWSFSNPVCCSWQRRL